MDNKELRATAQKIAKEAGVQVVYLNSKEEWFTSSNRAELSDKKENIQTFDFTKEPAEEVDTLDEVSAKAKQSLLKKISKATTVDALNKILGEGEHEEDVKAAIAAKVTELNDEAAKAYAAAKEAVLKKIANGKKKENIEALLVGFENDAEVNKAITDKVASLTEQA